MSNSEDRPDSRPRFHLSGVATIAHLNVRKEGPDDEKVLALDVKLSFKDIENRLCRYFEPMLPAFLWDVEREGWPVRNEMMGPVQYTNTVTKADVLFADEGIEFRDCDVKKFSLAPVDGGKLTVSCSVVIAAPSPDQVATLARYVQDGTRVEVTGPPDLFEEAAP